MDGPGVVFMKTSAKWKCLIMAVILLPLYAASCSTDFRDAVVGGALDFVSGSVTELLGRLIPVVSAIPPA
jgi:hypothetical protein